MPEPIWQQRPTENHYGTRHHGASVTVVETMFNTYARLVVTDEASTTGGDVLPEDARARAEIR